MSGWRPWQEEPKWTPIVADEDRIVCVVPGGPRSPDALLIAAAPEMKEMLVDVLRYLRSAGDRAKGTQMRIRELLCRTGWREEDAS
ncbi:MAG: hypothetical protein IJR14_09025 [Synergistaceae bacterium]|nr:hypothetical protein [Synergistaceae bacterium]